MVQLITGHGNMKGYLRRFNLVETDRVSECGQGLEEVDHVRYNCRCEYRFAIRNQIRREYGSLSVKLMSNNKVEERELRKVSVWAEVAIQEESYIPMDESDMEENDETGQV